MTETRVLVTGASGFIGACLARHRLRQGDEVHVLVRPTSNLWRLDDIRRRLHLHAGDLADGEAVRGILSAVRPHVLFHCACYGGFASQRDLEATVRTNILGTMRLVEALKGSETLLVNTGSSSEYGSKAAPMREEDLPEPLLPYGVTKAAATLACQAAGRLGELRSITLRLFSPFGPWDDPRRLVPTVIARCLRGRPLELSDGWQARDFVFIEDVLRAYDAAVRLEDPRGEILNIGSGRQHTIRETVETLARLCGYHETPRWGALPPAQPESARWVADITRARARLGWEPNVEFEAGLAQCVAWLRAHLTHYVE